MQKNKDAFYKYTLQNTTQTEYWRHNTTDKRKKKKQTFLDELFLLIQFLNVLFNMSFLHLYTFRAFLPCSTSFS